MSVFVGVDPALRKVGLCVLVNGKIDTLYLVKPHRDLRGPERLVYLRDNTNLILEPWKGKIKCAAVEAQSLGSIGDLDQLGQINGTLQVLLADLKVKKILKVPPANLKKFVTGSGQADKERMRLATEKLWGEDIPQDDLCDAHGLARFAEEAKLQNATLRYQVEAVYSVLRKKKRRKPVRRLHKKTI